MIGIKSICNDRNSFVNRNLMFLFFFQAEDGIRDVAVTWSSDVCSSDLDFSEELRQAAGYIDRILKGAKLTDLPIQQPIKYELVINLKAAKSLGLDVPDRLLAVRSEERRVGKECRCGGGRMGG